MIAPASHEWVLCKFCSNLTDQTFQWCNVNGADDQCIDCPVGKFNCEVIHTGSERATALVKAGMLDSICVAPDPCPRGTLLYIQDKRDSNSEISHKHQAIKICLNFSCDLFNFF